MDGFSRPEPGQYKVESKTHKRVISSRLFSATAPFFLEDRVDLLVKHMPLRPGKLRRRDPQWLLLRFSSSHCHGVIPLPEILLLLLDKSGPI